MDNTPLLGEEDGKGAADTTDGQASKPSDMSEKAKAQFQNLKDDIAGCLAMSKADWIATGMNQKNWNWLFLYLLALIVALEIMYHEVEGHTPILTVLTALISIFGLMGAGYQIYLSAKLEEQIQKFELENAKLTRNTLKMTTELDRFSGLRQDLEKFAKNKDDKFDETFNNVTEMFGKLKSTLDIQRQTLADQRLQNNTKFFYDIAFRDGNETMSKVEFMQASHAIPKYIKAAWDKYDFEHVPRANGQIPSNAEITIDEFVAHIERLHSESKGTASDNNVSV